MTIYEGNNKTTSKYGMRLHPTKKVNEMHKGSDEVGITSKRQRLVLPEGVVEAVNLGYSGGRGNNVVVRQNTARGVVRARYQHNAAALVKVGDRLKAGDIVGTEGSTGDSTGSHTHIEITVDGVAVDPAPWLGHPNTEGVWPQNDEVYDYGASVVAPVAQEAEKLRVFTVGCTVAEALEGAGHAAVVKLPGLGGAAYSRMARDYNAESLPAVAESLLGEMQPGEVLAMCNGYTRLFTGLLEFGCEAEVLQVLGPVAEAGAPFVVVRVSETEWSVGLNSARALPGTTAAQFENQLTEVLGINAWVVAG